MREATMAQVVGADALVMTAAVADFRPQSAQASKMKKDPARSDAPVLHLVRNPDILFEVGHSNIRPPLVIGFAAETGTDEEILAYGADKAARKGVDFICLNARGCNHRLRRRPQRHSIAGCERARRGPLHRLKG